MEIYDPPKPRDSPALRGLKYLALIVGCPLLLGTACAVIVYLPMILGDRSQWMINWYLNWDSYAALVWRFSVGALVGAIWAVVYVARCIARNEDP